MEPSVEAPLETSRLEHALDSSGVNIIVDAPTNTAVRSTFVMVAVLALCVCVTVKIVLPGGELDS